MSPENLLIDQGIRGKLPVWSTPVLTGYTGWIGWW